MKAQRWFLSAREATWRTVLLFLLIQYLLWWAASLVQQHWYGDRFSPVPYNVAFVSELLLLLFWIPFFRGSFSALRQKLAKYSLLDNFTWNPGYERFQGKAALFLAVARSKEGRGKYQSMHSFPARSIGFFLLVAVLLQANLYAEPVPVRHPQGSAHGFVALKTLEGQRIAVGDVTQIVRGDRVTSRVIFHFRDGSIDEDTTVFTQRGIFRLISDHRIQRGPSFPKTSDVFINALTGEITSHTKDGKIRHDHLDLPPDVSNGLPPNLLMNLLPATPETKLPFVAPAEKPRLIHVSIKPAGEVPFTVGGTKRKAIDTYFTLNLGASLE